MQADDICSPDLFEQSPFATSFNAIGNQAPSFLQQGPALEPPTLESKGSLVPHTLGSGYQPRVGPARTFMYDPSTNYRATSRSNIDSRGKDTFSPVLDDDEKMDYGVGAMPHEICAHPTAESYGQYLKVNGKAFSIEADAGLA